jgi:transcriptional regulator with XRE-family HTH domain
MSWPDRLKAAREYLREGQQGMADRLGVPYRTYQSYELGNSEPKSKVLEALLGLGFDANWILTGAGKMRDVSGTSYAEPRALAAGAPPYDEEDMDFLMDCFVAVTELLQGNELDAPLEKKKNLALTMFRKEKARIAALTSPDTTKTPVHSSPNRT